MDGSKGQIHDQLSIKIPGQKAVSFVSTPLVILLERSVPFSIRRIWEYSIWSFKVVAVSDMLTLLNSNIIVLIESGGVKPYLITFPYYSSQQVCLSPPALKVTPPERALSGTDCKPAPLMFKYNTIELQLHLEPNTLSHCLKVFGQIE